MDLASESRFVMPLDAGGTNLRFAEVRSGKPVAETASLPSNGDALTRCLANIIDGITRVKALCPEPTYVINFAFPGPANHPNGIIGDRGIRPGIRGGVALGPTLEVQFDISVFINHNGDHFNDDETIGGLLPNVNDLSEKAVSAKRRRNRLGITRDTGLVGGIVRIGELFSGDDSMADDAALLRDKLHPAMNAGQSACLRAVRRIDAGLSESPSGEVPDPKDPLETANDKQTGSHEAAYGAFRRLGESAGDVLA